MSDFWKFVVAVFWHWQSWAGGSGAGGAVVVFVAVYERLSGHNIGKRMYVSIFIVVFLIGSFFVAWRDQYHSAIEATQRFDELSKPQFEITNGSVSMLEITGMAGNEKLDYTCFFTTVTIFNRGAPSIVKAWKLTVKFPDGRELKGDPLVPLPSLQELVLNSPNGAAMHFPMTDLMFRKARENPIPKGGDVEGFVLFTFSPAGLYQTLSVPGTEFTLTASDISGALFEKRIIMRGKADNLRLAPALRLD